MRWRVLIIGGLLAALAPARLAAPAIILDRADEVIE